MSQHTNPELELAYNYVSQTDRHIFLTGKAGTGKTTFLHRVRERVAKRKVVVAPTGVAAINAKGVTIHSQFQLPFGVLTPDRLRRDLAKHRLSNRKVELLCKLDLLIIDEISMVRADVLDAIGAVLRKYRGNREPFGGVQLLMIGDLHQLPPVVRDAEEAQMSRHYATPYFFGSHELAKATARTIQLTHIYRQSDGDFIDLLNRVRNNRMDAATLAQLNSRYHPDFRPAPAEDYITLTSHNHTARTINERQLQSLDTPMHVFRAEVKGTFPESMYPNEPTLHLRTGAQVMFNKNDTGEERCYYNGKIGVVTAIEESKITVTCPGGERIEVGPVDWENRKYEVNKSKEVTDEVIGTYTQHPLRLAWAITIHKSQGLTFERVIIDAADAFAHGQVYVALSRCKTFGGIVLRSRLLERSVHTDGVVSEYSDNAEAPTQQDLLRDRGCYELNCLRTLFDFTHLNRCFTELAQVVRQTENKLPEGMLAAVDRLRSHLRERGLKVGKGFVSWLDRLPLDGALPSAHPDLRERLEGARTYYSPLLTQARTQLEALRPAGHDYKVLKVIGSPFDAVSLMLLTAQYAFASLEGGFTPGAYQRSRIRAEADFAAERSQQQIELPDFMGADPLRRRERRRHRRPDTKEVTLDAFRAGQSIADIAKERELTENTISNHLCYWIARGELRTEEVIDPNFLSPLLQHLIAQESTQGEEAPQGLKPIYEHFGGEYSYGEIKLAIGHHLAQQRAAPPLPH